ALAAAGAAAGGGLALATGGSSPPADDPPVPAGGSGFRSGATGARSLPEEPRSATERDQQRKADAKLPVPLSRAAARLFLVGFAGTTPSAPFFERLADREWGAVLIDGANVVDQAQLTALTGELGVVAKSAGQREPLVATRQLGGEEVAIPRIGPTAQPDIPNSAAARREAETTGRSLRMRGFDLVLAPSGDLQVTGGPWANRGFSDDPAEVARLVRGAIDGWKRARIAPVLGHFPGEGTASQDPELGVATVGSSREELRTRDQVPFTVNARTAPAMQMSGALYAGFDGVTPATLDPAVVRTLRQSGFRGAVVSSNLTAVTLATGEGVGAAAVAALKAGCDMLYVPGDLNDQEEAYRAVVKAVRDGRIPTSRVREALGRLDRLRAQTAPAG
nr:hypothetical protein [Solirubrobacterales bacterium]